MQDKTEVNITLNGMEIETFAQTDQEQRLAAYARAAQGMDGTSRRIAAYADALSKRGGR